MDHRRLLTVLLLCAAAMTVAGCSSNAKVEAHTTTVGQELQDLDAARDKGLLTEDEYQQKRREIMKRSN